MSLWSKHLREKKKKRSERKIEEKQNKWKEKTSILLVLKCVCGLKDLNNGTKTKNNTVYIYIYICLYEGI